MFSIVFPFLYLGYYLKTKSKLGWNTFFSLLCIFIGANFLMFNAPLDSVSLKERLIFIFRICGHGFILYLLYNLLNGLSIERQTKYIVPILAVSSSLNIIVNIIQIFSCKWLPAYLQPIKYRYYFRCTGLFMDPNYNGFFICICIYLLFYLYFSSHISKKIFFSILIGNSITMFFTLSFGTFLGFSLTGLIILFIQLNNRGRIIIGLITVVIAGAVINLLLFAKDYEFKKKEYKTQLEYRVIYYIQKKLNFTSGGARIVQYKMAIRAFGDHPLFGIGTLGFLNSHNYRKYSVGLPISKRLKRGKIIHSNFFAVLGENGIVGIIPYSGLLILSFVYSWKLYRKENRFIYIFGVELSSFIISNSINTLYFNFFWFILILPFVFYSSHIRHKY